MRFQAFYLVLIVSAILAAFYFYGDLITPQFYIASSSGAGEIPPPPFGQTNQCGEGHEPLPGGSCLARFELDLGSSGFVLNWDEHWNDLLTSAKGKATGQDLDIITRYDPTYFYIARSFFHFNTENLPLDALIEKAEILISRENDPKGVDDEFCFLISERLDENKPPGLDDYTSCGPIDAYMDHCVSDMINLDQLAQKNKMYSFPIDPEAINMFGDTELCARTWYDTHIYNPGYKTKWNYEALINLHHYKYGMNVRPILEVTYHKDLNRHTECNSNFQCEIVNSPGPNECESTEDCWHMGCSLTQCVLLTGKGTDECSTNEDCFHYECGMNDQCAKIAGDGVDECYTSSECKRNLAFNTIFGYKGMFGNTPPEALQNADKICNDEAKKLGYPGVYNAWLSTSAIDAKDRIPEAGYENTKGQAIALNKADLLDSELLHPILGQYPTMYRLVWTGTLPDGTYSGDSCEDWTFGSQGTVGYSEWTNKSWTKIGETFKCSNEFDLYCFQVA